VDFRDIPRLVQSPSAEEISLPAQASHLRFTATVNGSAVSLPSGYQAPFTLSFQTATASA